jgi:hypothetical protein
MLPCGIAGVSLCNVKDRSTSFFQWGLIASCGPLPKGKYSVEVDFDAADNTVDLYFVRNKCNQDPTRNSDEVRKWTQETEVSESVDFTVTESATYCFVLKNRNRIFSAFTSLTLEWTNLGIPSSPTHAAPAAELPSGASSSLHPKPNAFALKSVFCREQHADVDTKITGYRED